MKSRLKNEKLGEEGREDKVKYPRASSSELKERTPSERPRNSDQAAMLFLQYGCRCKPIQKKIEIIV